MHGLSPVDGDRHIDWSHASSDYAQWRPDYPTHFYEKLAAFGVGHPGQTILDLGTGVGYWANAFARRGAAVTGVDIAVGQIEQAREEARRASLPITFLVRSAEETGLPSHQFDIVSAGQCWLYFDHERIVPEVARLLVPNGLLVVGHFSWLARLDPIAKASESLILQHNPDWSAGDWSGEVPMMPDWAKTDFELVSHFVYDTPVPFSREQWRGRIRASRGIGATLNPAQVAAFDQAHEQMLADMAGPHFTVLHRLDTHILRLKKGA